MSTRKDALIYTRKGGESIHYDVSDVIVHASGALLVPRPDGSGTAFAPGEWLRGDIIIEDVEERAEGDPEESSEKPGS